MMAGNQKGQFKCLFLVQARVTVRRIVGRQILVRQTSAATGALRHRLAGEFEMHAS